MSPRWLRRRSRRAGQSEASGRAPDARSTGSTQAERGPKVLLEFQGADAEGMEILTALAKRYETSSLGEEGRHFQVVVDDAFFADEAVVRLASVLDEIEPDWQQHIAWPKAHG